MTLRKSLLVGVVWLLSLIAVATLTYAQAPRVPGNMLTGNDLGFIVEEQKGGLVFGRLMVRVDGEWRPVGGARRGHIVPLTK
jgi:hypothetical protein